MRRKYMRVDQGSPKFVVKRKRVKVAHLHDWVPSRPLYKLKIKLRGVRLHLGSPANLVARVMEKLHLNGMMPNPTKLSSGKGKKLLRDEPDTRRITFPKRTIRSSSNEVVDEAWFRFALNRAIAEGRFPLWSTGFKNQHDKIIGGHFKKNSGSLWRDLGFVVWFGALNQIL